MRAISYIRQIGSRPIVQSHSGVKYPEARGLGPRPVVGFPYGLRLMLTLTVAILCLASPTISLAMDAWFATTDPSGTPVLYRSPEEACFRGVMFANIDLDRASAPATAQYRVLSSVVQDEGDGGDYLCQGVIYRRSGPGATQWFLVVYSGEALITSAPNSSTPKCNDACCESGGCGNGSNPIQTSTGNKHQVEADFIGAGAFPLRLMRTYDSNRSIERAVRPLGAGWTHSYNAYVVGIGAQPFTQATVYRPDGRILKFQLVGGVWQSDPDVSERLAYTENDSTNTGMPRWTLITNDEEVEIYDGMGLLQSITNRSGLTQTLSMVRATTRARCRG